MNKLTMGPIKMYKNINWRCGLSNIYNIIRIESESTVQWDTVQSAEIRYYPWNESGYTPKAYAKMYCTDYSLHIQLCTFEKEIKTVYEKMNDPVYKDSCLEFFIQPAPLDDGRYLNFELNSRGTLLLGIGKGRDDRTLFGRDILKLLDIKTFLKPALDINEWGVEFCIPYDFLKQSFPSFKTANNAMMKGNFYKCGDETQYPHFGCWNPVISDIPDFHLSQYFGSLAIVTAR